MIVFMFSKFSLTSTTFQAPTPQNNVAQPQQFATRSHGRPSDTGKAGTFSLRGVLANAEVCITKSRLTPLGVETSEVPDTPIPTVVVRGIREVAFSG